MGKLYLHALFPNGDIDLHRDQVLTAHMRKLAQVITPQHRALRIPRGYLLECPWPSAQAAIATLNAYKVWFTACVVVKIYSFYFSKFWNLSNTANKTYFTLT